MKCSNCGANLMVESKYCPRCGTLFPSDDVKKNVNELELYLLGYYIKDKKINFNLYNMSLGYILFNFVYAFYKKMYFVGIVSFFNCLLFLRFVLGKFSYILNSYGFYFLVFVFAFDFCIFIYLFYAFKFNDLYIAKSKFNVQKVIKNNPDKTKEELSEICKKKGKNSYLLALLSLVTFLFMVFF